MPVTATPITSEQQWKEMRARNVGASEVGALFGCHDYRSALALHAEKTGRLPREDIESDAMERGKLMEDVAVKLIAKKFPTWRVEVPRAYYEDRDLRLGATPDLFATAPEPHGFGTIQIKSVEPGVFRRMWRDAEGDVTPPLWIALQAITEAHLCGANWCAVAALVVGHGIDLHVIDVPVSEGTIARIRDETARFWHLVDTDQRPGPDFGKDVKLIASLYPQDDGGEIDLSADNELPGILENRMQAADLASYAEGVKKACDAMILDKLGTAAVGLFAGGYVSAKTINKKAEAKPRGPYSYRQIRIVRREQAA